MKHLFPIIMALALVAGCTAPKCVLVSTGTVVGLDISESQTSPQATLAYKRAEVVYAPVGTNADVPDVLVEFRLHSALFSTNGGVYSRVAIGKHAVECYSNTNR